MNFLQPFTFSPQLHSSDESFTDVDDDDFDLPLPAFLSPNTNTPKHCAHPTRTPTIRTPYLPSPPIEVARGDSPFTCSVFSPNEFPTPMKPIQIPAVPFNFPQTPSNEDKYSKGPVPTPDFTNLSDSKFSNRKLTRTASSEGIIPETPKKRGQRSRLSHTPLVAQTRPPIHSPLHFAHELTPIVNESEVNNHLENHFDQMEKIGAGSFSNVFKARCIEDNIWYAIKILKRPLMGDTQRSKLIQELKIVKQMDHPHVLTYIFCWEQNHIPHFQMEMCLGGSLSYYMTSWQTMNRGRYFEESLLWKFLTDIALGLHHIHSLGIIHHDVKPGNIFVDAGGNLKIGDFGLADFEGSNTDTAEGDSRYLAPEILDDIVSKAADIFSFGATMFELACLIEMPTADEAWNVLRSGNVSSLPNFPPYSKEFKSIVDGMMHPQHNARATIEQIIAHPNVSANIECRKLTKGNDYMRSIHLSRNVTPKPTPPFVASFSQPKNFNNIPARRAKHKRNLMTDLAGM